MPEAKSENIILFEKYKNYIVKPSLNEVKNPPSRSAKLRFAVKQRKI